uniref:SEC7 domain-containing protein n=2 Tax=Tetranychus urticae TaxID=32264 RepID=T1L028_TETUR
MDQRESSMSKGCSLSNVSSGLEAIKPVSRDYSNGSSPCIPRYTNKDNQIPVLSYKGLRHQQHHSHPSPNHRKHVATPSWSSSYASSEISSDSTSDSANESTHPVNVSPNVTLNGPCVSSESKTVTVTVTTTKTTSSSSTIPTTTSATLNNNRAHHYSHHHNNNIGNKGSNHKLPCSPNVNSIRYPSFFPLDAKNPDNFNNSDMGKANFYEHFEYQYQQRQKYQQLFHQKLCDDLVGNDLDQQNQQHRQTSPNLPTTPTSMEGEQQQEQQEQPVQLLQQVQQEEQEEEEQSEQSEQGLHQEEELRTSHQKICDNEENNFDQEQHQALPSSVEEEKQPQDQEQESQQSDEAENEPNQETTSQENQETSCPVLNLNTSSISSSSSSTSENESSSEDEMEIPENCHYSPPKSIDRDAASRLAKRLYHLEGFKRSDVCRHLSKNNDFSRTVAEEYLKFFDFKGDKLDDALRKFLASFCLIGETQERERVLQHFSKRYLDCNPDSLKSTDALHTLTCAIMLLNTDLHGENVGRKMTCNEFIDNLSDLNDGQDFPRDVLVSIYQSIKVEPLQWALDDDLSMLNGVNRRLLDSGSGSSSSLNPAILGNNPFLKLPNPNTATEYKRGYIMRKCCFDMNGKRTPFGKRGWKMFYATLRDLVLFLHKDEQGFRKNQLYESLHNSIRIHHALATPATDYTKKQHVFRLQTADQSEYLFQTSDAQELQSWVDTINLVAGTLSAPPLPSSVGSHAKKFQKPLLPSSHTKFNTKEQVADHEMRIQRIAQALEDHVSKHPDKGAQRRVLNEYAEKQSYLEFELKRYSTYASILRSKLQQAFGSGALLEGPNKLTSFSASKSKPLTQLSIGEEQDIDEEKWAEEGHEYQGQVTVKPVSRSHRVSHRKDIR